jgi:hypothetical protein
MASCPMIAVLEPSSEDSPRHGAAVASLVPRRLGDLPLRVRARPEAEEKRTAILFAVLYN